MWMAVSAEPQRTSLHLSQWTHAGQRHMCGTAHSHTVSYLWVYTQIHKLTISHTKPTQEQASKSFFVTERLPQHPPQLPPVVPAWSSAWTVAAVSWTPTSSQSVAVSLIMEEIDVRLISAGTTARMEAHAHLPLLVRVGLCKLVMAHYVFFLSLVQ